VSPAADKARRVDVGFAGGQVLALRMKRGVYDGLRKALEPAERAGWHELETEDSQVAVDLAQVVYVRLDTEEHKVGF
jgi:hypothetical protein